MSWNITLLNLASHHDDATEGHKDKLDVKPAWWQDLWVSTYYKGDDLKKWKFPFLHTRKERAAVCFIFHASPIFCAEDKSHQLHPNILILFHRSLLRKGFSNSFRLSREVGVCSMLGVWQGEFTEFPMWVTALTLTEGTIFEQRQGLPHIIMWPKLGSVCFK